MIQSSKSSVNYTDHGTDSEHCSICTHYLNPTTCEAVVGKIVPGWWCKLFKRKEQAA